LPDRDRDGVADVVRVAIEDLRDSPHGLAFYDGYLYLAEQSTVTRFPYLGNGVVGETGELVVALPFGRGHLSRTVGFSRSDKMHISVGSSCNVCEESDQGRASIMEYDPDGSNARVFAEGVRNAVGFVFHPSTDEIWATENGRDSLGDDLPPDEINILRSGQNYGWPYCYGQNVPDPVFNDSGKCKATQESEHDLQAHSAPLGLRLSPAPSFQRNGRETFWWRTTVPRTGPCPPGTKW
jgi:glucose/arabinose dehydrogenase